ncbi:GTP 3',8-cyclase MoaA [Marinicrinis sediminis]|uniref:GTP 3',8-cyclase n=1 Tax=Marinicrinis sediminis TaxID=1652465 RepID=A0ABW5R6G5_9BACL
MTSLYEQALNLNPSSKLVDAYGRAHDYLRISVTDQCNLKCVYCMPEEGMTFEPASHLLTPQELTVIVETAAKLGIRKLRLTGGEPTVRKDLIDIIERLSRIPHIEDIALTTNGLHLARKARALKEAGITRLNISLDSLVPERYHAITRGGHLKQVFKGLEAAFEAGFSPIKLNVVVLKGVNDDEILSFVSLTKQYAIQVRFIEYMPIGHADEQWRSQYVSIDSIHALCEQNGMVLVPAEHVYGNGPSENWKLEGAPGTVGLIHPLSRHFCDSCNRLRLTADGQLKSCLYWEEEIALKPVLHDEQALIDQFHKAINGKPQNHEMAEALLKQSLSRTPTARRMSQIGG